MPVFYLDTSAVLKRYRTEAGTDVVDAIYDERYIPQRPDVLVTSYFTCLEVESVASRMFRGKLLDEKSYKALLNSFARDIDHHMTVLAVNSGVIRKAIDEVEFPAFSGDVVGALCEPLRIARGLTLRDGYDVGCDCKTFRYSH